MTLETVERHRKAANELRALPEVLAVDTLADGPTALETEVVTTADTDGLPPDALRIAARYDLTLGPCQPQGPHWQAVFR